MAEIDEGLYCYEDGVFANKKLFVVVYRSSLRKLSVQKTLEAINLASEIETGCRYTLGE